MGRSTTTKYALEMDGSTSRCWHTSRPRQWPKNIQPDGQPTLENLTKYVEGFIESLKPGGSNYHISKELGYMPIPNWARIVMNDGSRQVVVEWKAPMFMVI